MQANDQAGLAKLKMILAQISLASLQTKIRDFRRLDLRSINDQQLSDELLKVLSVEQPDGNKLAILRTYGTVWPQGTKFFRARGVGTLDMPPSSGKTVRDTEAPDGLLIKTPGRLHKLGESLLYTAIGDPSVTLSECRIPVGGFAVISSYKARRPIKASVIGMVDKDLRFSPDELIKINMINDFFHDEFTREVETGLEHLYRPSEMIAKWYFDAPSEFQDCWSYPSTKKKSATNAAFRPNKAHECLQLFGTMLSENTGTPDIKVHAIGRPVGKRIKYFPIGSPEQLALFPEITR